MAGFGIDIVPPASTPVSSPVSVAISPRRPKVPAFDLLDLPRPAAYRAVGLRQGGRGLRSGLRLLRHPELPRPAAQPVDRPTSWPRSTSSTRARSCWWPRTWRPTGATRADGRRDLVPLVEAVAERVDWVRLLYLYPSELTDGAHRRGAGHRRAVLRPVAAARRPRRCCAACAAGATATASSSASTAIRGRRARRRLPLELHRRLPRRDRGRPRPAARVRRRGPARLVRLLRLLPGGGHLRRRASTARCRPA